MGDNPRVIQVDLEPLNDKSPKLHLQVCEERVINSQNTVAVNELLDMDAISAREECIISVQHHDQLILQQMPRLIQELQDSCNSIEDKRAYGDLPKCLRSRSLPTRTAKDSKKSVFHAGSSSYSIQEQVGKGSYGRCVLATVVGSNKRAVKHVLKISSDVEFLVWEMYIHQKVNFCKMKTSILH